MDRGLISHLCFLSKMDCSYSANLALTLESIHILSSLINQIVHTNTFGFRHERLDAGRPRTYPPCILSASQWWWLHFKYFCHWDKDTFLIGFICKQFSLYGDTFKKTCFSFHRLCVWGYDWNWGGGGLGDLSADEWVGSVTFFCFSEEKRKGNNIHAFID